MDKNYFTEFQFSKDQIKQHYLNATRDLMIAKEDKFNEVRFTYAYQALIKLAICILAKQGYKVNSIQGHHVKLLDEMSKILNNTNIYVMGNAMRMKRNQDLYGAGTYLSIKEVEEAVEFVDEIAKHIKL